MEKAQETNPHVESKNDELLNDDLKKVAGEIDGVNVAGVHTIEEKGQLGPQRCLALVRARRHCTQGRRSSSSIRSNDRLNSQVLQIELLRTPSLARGLLREVTLRGDVA